MIRDAEDPGQSGDPRAWGGTLAITHGQLNKADPAPAMFLGCRRKPERKEETQEAW